MLIGRVVREQAGQRENAFAARGVEPVRRQVDAINRCQRRRDIGARVGEQRQQGAAAAGNLVVDELVKLLLHGFGQQRRVLGESRAVFWSVRDWPNIEPAVDEVAQLLMRARRRQQTCELSLQLVRRAELAGVYGGQQRFVRTRSGEHERHLRRDFVRRERHLGAGLVGVQRAKLGRIDGVGRLQHRFDD